MKNLKKILALAGTIALVVGCANPSQPKDEPEPKDPPPLPKIPPPAGN